MLRRLRDGKPCSGFKGRLQRGVALLEVLIAVVILSIGMLGLASLQVNSLRFNHSAYLRSQATILAYDITERMRANRQVALDGEYNLALGATPAAETTVVAIDLLEWRAQLAAQLPGGDGAIDVDGANDTVTITVAWDDTRGAGAATLFTFRTQL
jgi:type IV pilus assembly protein PilV